MPDGPLNLGFAETATAFESPSQNARVWTEQWVHESLFCPNCGAERIRRYPNNQPAADFFCETCAEDYELKSSKSRFGASVMDGAFATNFALRCSTRTVPAFAWITADTITFSNSRMFPGHG